jgi:hypothetical protein
MSQTSFRSNLTRSPSFPRVPSRSKNWRSPVTSMIDKSLNNNNKKENEILCYSCDVIHEGIPVHVENQHKSFNVQGTNSRGSKTYFLRNVKNIKPILMLTCGKENAECSLTIVKGSY